VTSAEAVPPSTIAAATIAAIAIIRAMRIISSPWNQSFEPVN
jgi:hypothetical protein